MPTQTATHLAAAQDALTVVAIVKTVPGNKGKQNMPDTKKLCIECEIGLATYYDPREPIDWFTKVLCVDCYVYALVDEIRAHKGCLAELRDELAKVRKKKKGRKHA